MKSHHQTRNKENITKIRENINLDTIDLGLDMITQVMKFFLFEWCLCSAERVREMLWIAGKVMISQ